MSLYQKVRDELVAKGFDRFGDVTIEDAGLAYFSLVAAVRLFLEGGDLERTAQEMLRAHADLSAERWRNRDKRNETLASSA